jgi:hypothetical protein
MKDMFPVKSSPEPHDPAPIWFCQWSEKMEEGEIDNIENQQDGKLHYGRSLVAAGSGDSPGMVP